MSHTVIHVCCIPYFQAADDEGLLHFETSANTGSHVRDAFYLLTCSIMNRQIEADPKNLINTNITEGAPPKKSGCC